MKTCRTLALTLLVGVLFAAPAAAQASGADDVRILSTGALYDAVAGHELAVDRQRAQLAELLSRPQVRDLVRDRGIDMERVEAAAAALTDAEIAELAPLVASAKAALQQRGGSISISVVGVIIILALVIILILLVR